VKLEMIVPIQVVEADGTVVRDDTMTMVLFDDGEEVPSDDGESEDRPEHL